MDRVFQHVLVATDGSQLADRALALAARVGADSRVTALMVMHDYGLPEYLRAALGRRPDAQELRAEILAEGRRSLDETLSRAVPGNGHIERRVVLSDRSPCHEIVALAEQEPCDLIVVGSHGLGGRLAGLVGSQSQAVISLATVPVMVVR
jgi:nucleotide-binding universal stress UspA family protein